MADARTNYRQHRFVLLLVATCCLSTGCSRSGPPGVDLHGTVTWKGAPVPRGSVIFSPDTKKGGKGHQGMAPIKDGVYDTRNEKGRRVALGPQIVSIRGYDGENPTKFMPVGYPMFSPHEQPIEVDASSDEINLVVPDTVSGLPKTKGEDF